jgi:hypothetical protein
VSAAGLTAVGSAVLLLLLQDAKKASRKMIRMLRAE